MKPVLFYLLQVVLATGILYGYYHLALRNKKFHQYNRIYLLAAVFIGMVIPLFSIPVRFSQENNVFPVLQTLSVITGTDTGTSLLLPEDTLIKANLFTWENFVYGIYFLIVFIITLRIVFSLNKIRSIIKNNTVEKLDKVLFVRTNEPGTPFSFFRWLFWNNKIDLQSAEGKQIFRHEIFHIRQKHSIDIVFMEILSAVFWVNPFFYLVKKELKAIHEFLADRFAINKTDPHSYAELLLMQALDTKYQLINPFFHNQIKRRIAMITSNKSTGRQYLQKVAVLPLAALLIAVFAFSYQTGSKPNPGTSGINVADTIPKPHSKKQTLYLKNRLVFETDSLIFPSKNASTIFPDYDKIHVIVNGHTENTAILKNKTLISERITLYTKNDPIAIKLYGKNAEYGVIIFEGAQILDIPPQVFYKDDFAVVDKKLKVTDNKEKAEDNKVFVKMEIEPSFPGGEYEWKKYLIKNLDPTLPIKKGAPAGQYTVIVQFVVDKEGMISDIRALTKHGYGMEEEAMRVIRLGPKWQPGIQNGLTVKGYKKQPITFYVQKKPPVTSIQYDRSGNIIAYDQIIRAKDFHEINAIKLTMVIPEDELLGFRITFHYTKEARLQEFINYSSKLSTEIKSALKKVSVGDFVTIEDVRAKIKNEEKRMPAVIYSII